jgi:hypothetical protein
MCHYQTWFHKDDMGYVVQCAGCKKIQVGFNIIAVTFSHADFESFRKAILKTYTSRQHGVNENIKSILIPSPCEGLNLLLSANELKALHCMLEEADNEMKAQNLLNVFENLNK